VVDRRSHQVRLPIVYADRSEVAPGTERVVRVGLQRNVHLHATQRDKRNTYRPRQRYVSHLGTDSGANLESKRSEWSCWHGTHQAFRYGDQSPLEISQVDTPDVRGSRPNRRQLDKAVVVFEIRVPERGRGRSEFNRDTGKRVQPPPPRHK
jgi:hypothetical protein